MIGKGRSTIGVIAVIVPETPLLKISMVHPDSNDRDTMSFRGTFVSHGGIHPVLERIKEVSCIPGRLAKCIV